MIPQNLVRSWDLSGHLHVSRSGVTSLGCSLTANAMLVPSALGTSITVQGIKKDNTAEPTLISYLQHVQAVRLCGF